MAVIFCCGAECQNAGSSGGNDGRHWHSTVATPTVDTTTFEPGGGVASFRFNTTAAAAYLAFNQASMLRNVYVGRVYFYFHTLPSGTATIIRGDHPTTAFQIRVTTGGQVTVQATSSANVGSPISVDEWHYVDFSFDASANPHVAKATLDGGTEASVSPAGTPANFTDFLFGSQSGITADFYLDQFILGDELSDYPFGEGNVRRYDIESISGTHSTPGSFTRSTGGNPTDGDSSGDLLNETVGDITSYIDQSTIGTGDYIEYLYNANVANAPRAVEQFVAAFSVSTPTGTAKPQLYDGVSASDHHALAVVGTTANVAARKTKQWASPPSGGSWTADLFNALRLRWGFSDDITPTPSLSTSFIEAEFTGDPGTGGGTASTLSHVEYFGERDATGEVDPELNITGVSWDVGDRLYVIVSGRDDTAVVASVTDRTGQKDEDGEFLFFGDIASPDDTQGQVWMSALELSSIAQSGLSRVAGVNTTITVRVTSANYAGGLQASVLVVSGAGPSANIDDAVSAQTGASDTTNVDVSLEGSHGPSRIYWAVQHRDITSFTITGANQNSIRNNDQIGSGSGTAGFSSAWSEAFDGQHTGTLSPASDWVALAFEVYEIPQGQPDRRLNAKWFNFSKRGHAWHHFWHDANTLVTKVSSFTLDAVLASSATVVNQNFTADAIIKRTQTGSFTANSVLKKTISATFTADAVLKKTISATFTADAILKRTQTGSLTADAVLKKNVSSTKTADAVLKKTMSGSFTADSILRKTFSVTFTADVVLKATRTGSLTADAVLKATRTQTFTADAVLRRTFTQSFTVDAVIKRTQAGSFTADAVLKATRTQTFTADAVIKRTQTGSATADAVLRRTFSQSITADAVLFATRTQTLTADAVLFRTQTGSATADSVLFRNRTGSFTADAFIQGSFSGAITVDAVLFRTQTGTFTADAFISITISQNFTADSVLKRNFSATFTNDAVIKAAITASFTADAVLKQNRTASFTADAVLLASRTGGLTGDSVIRATRSGSATADAILRKAFAGSFAADAVINTGGVGTLTANAVIKATRTGSLTADAILRKTITGSFTADAFLSATSSQSLTADAVLKATRSGSFTEDAILRRTFTGQFTADAYLKLVRTATLTADAVLFKTRTSSFTVDAIKRQANSGSLTADAQLTDGTHLGSFTVDAWFATVHPETISGIITTSTISSRISTSGIIRHSITSRTISADVHTNSISAEITIDGIEGAI